MKQPTENEIKAAANEIVAEIMRALEAAGIDTTDPSQVKECFKQLAIRIAEPKGGIQ